MAKALEWLCLLVPGRERFSFVLVTEASSGLWLVFDQRWWDLKGLILFELFFYSSYHFFSRVQRVDDRVRDEKKKNERTLCFFVC